MESESKRNTIAIRTPAAATEGDCFMILLLLHAPG